MSGPQVHGARRIRILTAAGIPAAAPASARERFRQMVQPARRGEETGRSVRREDGSSAPPTIPPLAEFLATAPLGGEARATDAPTAEASATAPPPSSPPPGAQTLPLQAPSPARIASREKCDTAEDGDEFGTRIARALMREQRGHALVEHLAERVAELCNAPQIGAGGSWEFRLDIDPVVLPDTGLLLRLGGGRLSLRFDSRDDTARQLVREHRQALAARLAAALRERYDVTIEAW